MSAAQTVAIVGAGTMGAGIAQVAAMHGCTVQLIDVQPDFVARGLAGIAKNLDRLAEKGKLCAAERDAALGRIHTGMTTADLTAHAACPPHPALSPQGGEGLDPPSSGSLLGRPQPLGKGGGGLETGSSKLETRKERDWNRDEALAGKPPVAPGLVTSCQRLDDVQLVIEAVVENLDIKKKLFKEIEAAVPSGAILATNTSSLSVSQIAEAVKNPGRVVGMHFFNPAPLMPLVEIIAGKHSDPAAVEFAFNAAVAWGKTAVRAKDTPGFIVNRVARGYYLEALRLLGEGVAGVDEIDGVMRKFGGFKMGPFELMDLVGLDVNLAVSTSVWEQMNKHPRFEPHEIQKQLVAKGYLGRKTASGFYAYDREPPLPAYTVERRSFSLSPMLGDVIRAFAAKAMNPPRLDPSPSGGGSPLPGPVIPLSKGDRVTPPVSPLSEGGGRERKDPLCVPHAGSTEQYVFTRILAAVINEAGLALDESVATREDVDLAMMKGTNYPKGPLAWAEEVGIRTVRGVLKLLNESVARGRYTSANVFSVPE